MKLHKASKPPVMGHRQLQSFTLKKTASTSETRKASSILNLKITHLKGKKTSESNLHFWVQNVNFWGVVILPELTSASENHRSTWSFPFLGWHPGTPSCVFPFPSTFKVRFPEKKILCCPPKHRISTKNVDKVVSKAPFFRSYASFREGILDFFRSCELLKGVLIMTWIQGSYKGILQTWYPCPTQECQTKKLIGGLKVYV